ncbi:bacterio-opsin activator domain-containing protein [Haloarchaeobius baliensis]|uniref:bacterio-opsin activator domain-containing protein n=1 Tax=Haloarchaeobius baliensis TaxID=1670458 RepID=UPI003F885811
MAPAAPTAGDVLEKVDDLGPPSTPVTTPEVAAGFDCTQRTIYNRLEALVEDGVLETKKVGANSRVWWRPVDGGLRRNRGAPAPGGPVSLRDEQSPPFTADCEMAERIREFDWAETPIGPMEEWPAELRTAVDIMLGADEAIGIYWGDDLTLLYNDLAGDVIGKKHPDALGQPARDVFPEAWDTLGPVHEQVMAGGGATRLEELLLPLERTDEIEDIWWDTSYNPIPLADGSVGGVFNVAVDVTERKQAEIERERAMEALQESEERYRTLFDSLNESMQEGFCVVELLEEGEATDESSNRDETAADRNALGDYRFVEVNPAFEELTGMTDVVGTRRSDLDVDGDVPGFDVCAEVARTGESRRLETNGEPLVDGWFDVRVFPYGGSDSRQVAVLVDDITERKEVNAALRESEKRLRLATDIADIAVFEWDLETDRVSGNERMHELFGYDEQETIVGQALLDERIHPDDLESVTDQLEAVFESASDGEYEFEFRARLPDGGERWVLTNGEVFFEEDGDDRRAVRVFGTGIDITEQKQREEQQEFLLRFSDALRAQPDAESIEETAVEMLAEQLDVDRCWIAKVSEEEGVARVGPERFRSNLQPMSGTFQISDSQEVMRRLATQTIQIPNLADDPRFSDSEKELHAGLNIVALLSVPLRKGEHEVIWAFPAAMAEPRQWTDNERILLEEAAERTWEAVERTRAEQVLNRSNQSLERLNDASRELIDADPETIGGRVAELVVEVLDVEYAALWGYDAQTGDLELDTEHAAPGTDFDAIRPAAVSHEQVWGTFVGGEFDVENALDIAEDDAWPAGLRNRVFAPLGRHGVVCVGSEDPGAFDDRLLDLLQMVVSTVKTAWSRAESEQEVARQNEELTRLDQLNTLIRSIHQVLVAADTREGIDEAVCEQLANSDLYESAWLATYDAATDTLRPQTWAGIDSRYLEHRTVTVGDGSSDDPLVAAHRTHEMQIISDIAVEAQAASWREDALERGARSAIIVPLVYEESTYGMLTVYGRTPQPDERETEVLAELGGTIAHAIHALEATTTRRTDSVVELTLQTRTAETPLVRLSRELDCELEFEGLVPGDNGDTTVFFTASDVAPEALVADRGQVLAIEELRHVADRETGALFKARLAGATLPGRFLERGATIRSLSIDAGTATAVVELPETAEVRECIEELRRDAPDLDLLSRRTRTREPQTTLQSAVLDRLTPRQEEVLQLAYRSGYFEMPRIQSGTELADVLGIVPSTFTKHIRTAERNVLDAIFADEQEPPERGEK